MRNPPSTRNGTYALDTCCRMGSNTASHDSTTRSREIVGASKCPARPSSQAKQANNKTVPTNHLAKEHRSIVPMTPRFLVVRPGSCPRPAAKVPTGVETNRISLRRAPFAQQGALLVENRSFPTKTWVVPKILRRRQRLYPVDSVFFRRDFL